MKTKKHTTKNEAHAAEFAAYDGITEAAAVKQLAEREKLAKKDNRLAEFAAQHNMKEETLVKRLAALGFTDMRVAALAIQQVTRLRDAWTYPVKGAETVVEWLWDMKPEDTTQAMLALQMIGTHLALVSSLCCAAPEPRRLGLPDVHLTRATRLGRLCIEQMDAMARLKGKNRQQKVTVEHVHVGAGGQAIVGTLSTAGQDRMEGESHASRKKTP